MENKWKLKETFNIKTKYTTNKTTGNIKMMNIHLFNQGNLMVYKKTKTKHLLQYTESETFFSFTY